MNIALMAHENRRELMVQFCTAYAGILTKHNLSCGSALGNLIEEETAQSGMKLVTNKLIASSFEQVAGQIASRISCQEVDILLFFRDPQYSGETDILRLCDSHNIPVATNMATAETIVMALDRGDLEWIEISRR